MIICISLEQLILHWENIEHFIEQDKASWHCNKVPELCTNMIGTILTEISFSLLVCNITYVLVFKGNTQFLFLYNPEKQALQESTSFIKKLKRY